MLSPMYTEMMFHQATLIVSKLCLTLSISNTDIVSLTYIALYMEKDPDTYKVFLDRFRQNGDLMNKAWGRFYDLVKEHNEKNALQDVSGELNRILKENL